MLNVVSLAAIVWSRHTIPFGEREYIAQQDQITVAKQTMFTAIPQTNRNQNYLFTVSCLKNIIPHNFTTKSKQKLCCICNRP